MNVKIKIKNMELCAKYLDNEQEKMKCLNRMMKHFNSQKVIAEKTLERLEKSKNV